VGFLCGVRIVMGTEAHVMIREVLELHRERPCWLPAYAHAIDR
jgi:hypothetical protein